VGQALDLPPKLRGHVYVCCPASTVTGGPELLHQLVSEINSLGGQASIVYVPIGVSAATPNRYLHYLCPVATTIPDTPDSIVVAPEVMFGVLRQFRRATLVAWWLSVDNYTHPGADLKSWMLTVRRRFFNDWPNSLRLVHLVQSHYAKSHLVWRYQTQSHLLGDYIDPGYWKRQEGPPVARLPRVAFNPKKGLALLKRLQAQAPEFNFLPLENMTADEVRTALLGSSVYLDLGNHPGKDRIPREAAVSGCVVLVGLHGSARNPIDVPINERYKIDTSLPDWVDTLRRLLAEVMRSPEAHAEQQMTYRQSIAAEREVFRSQVAALFT
jgi:hypothetical protein